MRWPRCATCNLSLMPPAEQALASSSRVLTHTRLYLLPTDASKPALSPGTHGQRDEMDGD